MADRHGMRRFRFRLASVLRLRSQVERVARKELAAAMADVNTLRQQLDAAQQALSDCADQAARGDAVGRLARALEGGMRRHMWRLDRQHKQAEQRLEGVRGEYSRKARELKTLQRLRDQEHDVWRQDALRAEQAELDELAVLTQSEEQGEGTW